MTADGDLVAVTDTALTRNSLATLEPLASLPKPFGGGHTIEIDDAARTMLVVGWDNRGSLYDMADGIRLGDPLQTVSPERADGAHLSQDGAHLVTGAPKGFCCGTESGGSRDFDVSYRRTRADRGGVVHLLRR